jgi:hypothetical protein
MPPRPTALDNLRRRSEQFASGEDMARLLDALLDDDELRSRAQREPEAVLRERRIRAPRGTRVKFSRQPRLTRPAPGFQFFSIRLTRCRTFWRPDEPGQPPREVTICFGFEIVPHPLPGGPIG